VLQRLLCVNRSRRFERTVTFIFRSRQSKNIYSWTSWPRR